MSSDKWDCQSLCVRQICFSLLRSWKKLKWVHSEELSIVIIVHLIQIEIPPISLRDRTHRISSTAKCSNTNNGDWESNQEKNKQHCTHFRKISQKTKPTFPECKQPVCSNLLALVSRICFHILSIEIHACIVKVATSSRELEQQIYVESFVKLLY